MNRPPITTQRRSLLRILALPYRRGEIRVAGLHRPKVLVATTQKGADIFRRRGERI